MANSRQAKKRILINAKKRLRNVAIKSAVKTVFKKANLAILEEKNPEKAEVIVGKAVIAIDKAATKGIIHKNRAARKKSRIMKKLNNLKAEVAA
ncbi:MAG: 30S ribosomal protein S20 [Candidatus Eremiobacteraeota bacterium]|nr:30S ribosomal protein S20 [Candidatus Eremiobacteraeota bacterium]